MRYCTSYDISCKEYNMIFSVYNSLDDKLEIVYATARMVIFGRLTIARIVDTLFCVQWSENGLQHITAHLHARLNDEFNESYLRFCDESVLSIAKRRERQSEFLLFITLPEELF